MKENKNEYTQRSQVEEETKHKASFAQKWKSIRKKKWFFPAVYLIAAALILAFITWYQSPDDFAMDPDEFDFNPIVEDWADEHDNSEPVTQDETGNETVDEGDQPVTTENEGMQHPVSLLDGINIVTGFFDDHDAPEVQQEAMIQYEQSYYPSQGVDFAREDGETFAVYATMSGTVKEVETAPLIGEYVSLEHDQQLVTVYQSLANIQVAVGDEISQGTLLGYAGRSEFRKDLGVHLHYEVHEEGSPMNPVKYLAHTDM